MCKWFQCSCENKNIFTNKFNLFWTKTLFLQVTYEQVDTWDVLHHCILRNQSLTSMRYPLTEQNIQYGRLSGYKARELLSRQKWDYILGASMEQARIGVHAAILNFLCSQLALCWGWTLISGNVVMTCVSSVYQLIRLPVRKALLSSINRIYTSFLISSCRPQVLSPYGSKHLGLVT